MKNQTSLNHQLRKTFLAGKNPLFLLPEINNFPTEKIYYFKQHK